MSLESFKRQTAWGWGVSIFLIGFVLFSVGFITAPAIRWQLAAPEVRSTLDNKPLPDDWTWTQIILMDLGILLTVGYLSSAPITQVRTKFSDEGIEQPTLLQNKVIRWENVQKVSNITTANIEISDSKTKIYINPNLFANPDALINELRLRVPSSAFPNDKQVSQEVTHHKRNDSGRTALGAILFGIFTFIVGKGVIAYIIGLLLLGYGAFEFSKWLKFWRNP
jgi:hypothetical protein